ncbi:hypothetical protein [Streptomyces canarius]|uniref:Uncharacterized protein n=1 Tax=Streptomyces canarius TaxID=285453 RepID=A0ABQ3DBS2_9ACTN|nr:hypothetical protein GCM10010345_88610 [Streptomyces canarius]
MAELTGGCDGHLRALRPDGAADGIDEEELLLHSHRQHSGHLHEGRGTGSRGIIGRKLLLWLTGHDARLWQKALPRRWRNGALVQF